MAEVYGIKETKEVVVFGLDLALALQAANADGKVNMLDAPLFWKPVKEAPEAIEGAAQVFKEFSDLDAEEVGELVAVIEEKTGHSGSKAVQIVEAALKFGVAGLALVAAIKAPAVVLEA